MESQGTDEDKLTNKEAQVAMHAISIVLLERSASFEAFYGIHADTARKNLDNARLKLAAQAVHLTQFEEELLI